ncbi:MAG: TfuA-like protein [Geminicoccaceae bacterium]
MNGTVVFLGPTLGLREAVKLLDADYRPPAARSDVTKAVGEGIQTILLIDGHFHSVPTVTHKELMFALASGVRVIGAASLGALRAAELEPFGMEGYGWVYEAYRSGSLTRDDEVAVQSAPEELGFAPVTDALVDIRGTLEAAKRAGVIDEEADALLAMAQATHFPMRTWTNLIGQARAAGLDVDQLEAWLPQGRCSRKAEDSKAVLTKLADGSLPPKPNSSFTWAETFHFHRLRQSVGVVPPCD